MRFALIGGRAVVHKLLEQLVRPAVEYRQRHWGAHDFLFSRRLSPESYVRASDDGLLPGRSSGPHLTWRGCRRDPSVDRQQIVTALLVFLQLLVSRTAALQDRFAMLELLFAAQRRGIFRETFTERSEHVVYLDRPILGCKYTTSAVTLCAPLVLDRNRAVYVRDFTRQLRSLIKVPGKRAV